LVTEMPDSHEYVVRTPSSWSIEMNRLPPTQPANATMPSWAAKIWVPKGAPMSIPRWPGPYGFGGGSKPRITGPTTGQA
jgi:hypothetical protein